MRLRSVASLNTSLIPVYSSYPPLHARYQTACSPPPAQSDQAAPRVLPTRMERRGPEGCLIRRRRNQHHWKIGENESKAEASAAVSHIAQRCTGESTPPTTHTPLPAPFMPRLLSGHHTLGHAQDRKSLVLAYPALYAAEQARAPSIMSVPGTRRLSPRAGGQTVSQDYGQVPPSPPVKQAH